MEEKMKNTFLKLFFVIANALAFQAQADIINPHTPKVAVDSLGNAVAVWQAVDTVNGTNVIQASTYSAILQTWASPIVISDESFNSINPLVAVNQSNGNAVVIWSMEDSTTRWLIGINKPFIGSWGTAYEISTDDVYAYSTEGSYGINFDSIANTIFIAWTAEDLTTGETSIRGSRAVFGGGWSTTAVSGTP